MGTLRQKSNKFKNLKGKLGGRIKNKNPYQSKNSLNSNYIDGISVITPSYKGEKYISKLLDSMKNQKLSYKLFEHIIVINGELDNTPRIVEDFKEKNPNMNIKIIYSEIDSASNARNIAIEESNRAYSTFIDDDDYISPDYLKEIYKNSSENRIVIAGFFDVEEDTGKISDSYVTPNILTNKGIVKDAYNKLTSVLTINACKLIPTYILKQVKFNADLSSGEDIVFFCKLFTLFNLEFYVSEKSREAVYYRLLRSNSVSRKTVNFEFNVIERLGVIKELDNLLLIADNITKKFIKQKIRAQSLFINEYLLQYPNEIQRVREIIKNTDLNHFPYNLLNKNLAKKLVIAYCFPPYVDTSGNVMAKRINDKEEIVDVIHNKIDRKIDYELNLIADEFIDKKILINSPPAFGGWYGIKQFCKKGMKKIDDIIAEKGEYKELYSRAMFPASHFLAFEHKIKYTRVKWIAEFSDPVIYDIKGNIRESDINDPEFMDKVNNLIQEQGFPKCEYNNAFFLCEYLAYIFADELIFTNKNQREYMISKFPYQEIADVIKRKSRIERHPTPRKELYNLKESNYSLNNSYVNLAYFGSFYDTRNLNEVFLALYSLDDAYKNKCKIHFFTSNAEDFKKLIECIPIKDNIEVNSYLNFFEFLNLTTKLDALIVNDAHTKGYKEINPYLPSKLSDYLGSGTDIWILSEEGSPMSKVNVKYNSPLGDMKATRKTLKQIIKDHT